MPDASYSFSKLIVHDLEKMAAWSGGCGLAVDHQHFEVRERLGGTG